MSVEAHNWGASLAADRLWSFVVGYGSNAGKRLLMFLQANIDDSEDHEGGTFVLGGYIAPAASWDAFVAEWESLVATDGVYDEPGSPRYFKMKRMARQSRLPRVEGFYRIIEKHALAALSCSFNIHDLARAKRRIFCPGVAVNLDDLDKYVFAYRLLLDAFHGKRDEFPEALPPTEKVDFIFDFQKQAERFLRVWNDYIERRPKNLADIYGERPVPKDEKEWLPLQAADLWAWWVRKWVIEGREDEMHRPNFGPFQEERKGFLKVHISTDEDKIAGMIMSFIADELRPFQIVYDIGSPNGIRGSYGRKCD